ALELGADDYLVKPVESRELVTRLKVMLERGARLRQRGAQARGRLTVVAGAKGGIGTSTVAMNLAALHAGGKGADAVVLADLVVVEPEIIGVELTRQFLERLHETGILSHRIRLVISNAHGSLQLSRTEVAAALKLEVAAMILYQRDEFSAASKRRMPIVIHHAQAQATAQFAELMQALVAV